MFGLFGELNSLKVRPVTRYSLNSIHWMTLSKSTGYGNTNTLEWPCLCLHLGKCYVSKHRYCQATDHEFMKRKKKTLQKKKSQCFANKRRTELELKTM